MADFSPESLPDGLGSLVRLENDRFLAVLAPKAGGRVAGFWEKGRRGLMAWLRPLCRASANGRLQGGSFPLIPYSNRIAYGRFEFNGHRITLPAHPAAAPHSLHGVGWDMSWEVVSASGETAHISAAIAKNHPGWPWRLGLTQTITLSTDGLSVRLEAENTDQGAQPVGLGHHPYFPRTDNTRLAFHAEAIWQWQQARLQRIENTRFDFSRNTSLPDRNVIDHQYEGVSAQAHMTSDSGTLTIESDPVTSRAVLFTPQQADFFCFEPVSHRTNALNTAHLTQAELTLLPAGACSSLTLQLRPTST